MFWPRTDLKSQCSILCSPGRTRTRSDCCDAMTHCWTSVELHTKRVFPSCKVMQSNAPGYPTVQDPHSFDWGRTAVIYKACDRDDAMQEKYQYCTFILRIPTVMQWWDILAICYHFIRWEYPLNINFQQSCTIDYFCHPLVGKIILIIKIYIKQKYRLSVPDTKVW